MAFVFCAAGGHGGVLNKGTKGVFQDNVLCVCAVALRLPDVEGARAWVGNEEEKVRGTTSRIDVDYRL